MPSGQVHAACSVALSPICGGLALAYSGDPVLAAACAGGCALGVLLTPDLDQTTLCSSEAAIVKYTFGLGFLWVMFWYPYARLIPHRSHLSHAPILGTAGRLLYAGALAAIPAYFMRWNFQIAPEIWPMLFYALAGLLVSDTAHFVFDIVGSRLNRTRRRVGGKISKMTLGLYNPLESKRK